MKVVFDTNILVDYLNGIVEAKKEIQSYTTSLISIVTWMEILVGAEKHAELVTDFLARFETVNLSENVAKEAVNLRRTFKLKLPDAIIYATARSENCLFVTRNTKDFSFKSSDIKIPYRV